MLIITIRLIKSFEFRTCKNLVLQINDTSMQVSDLKKRIQAEIISKNLKPYMQNKFNTLKIYMKPHGSKTNNLIINIEHDDKAESELILHDDMVLADYGIDNEWELSFYNDEEYQSYKKNPQTKW